MRRGIFIGRFQPFHLGHLSIVEEMEKAQDIDEIIIGIGTAQCGNTAYNPFTANERKGMIEKSLKNIKKHVYIIKIEDINDYPRWVGYVESLCPKFHVVYSGNSITKKLFEGKGYEVRTPKEDKIKISATEIRQLIITDGNWQDYVPKGVKEFILKIGSIKRLKEISGRFMNPALTADIIIEYKDKGIVLIKRKYEPFKNMWALPGGFIETGQEAIETTAVRETKEETFLDIKEEDLKLFCVNSKPGRDPRGPTVSVVFSVKLNKGNPKAADDALEIKTFKKIPEKLAFDHKKILKSYFKK